MDSRDQLFEAAKRISRLIGAAAAPARREAAALAGEAPLVKARRTETRLRLDAATTRAARLGWIPFVGEAARSRQQSALLDKEQADEEWASVLSRARFASDLMASARAASSAASEAEARARRGGPMPLPVAEGAAELILRVRFLAETDGRDRAGAARLAPKVFALAEEARDLARAWDGSPLPAFRVRETASPSVEPPGLNVPAKALGGKRVQFSLDFDGTGAVEEEARIWLPVSTSRAREMIELGARVEKERGRGSRLWIPVSERGKLDAFLPLAFRRKATKFAFPPIRHNAAKQNLWSMFDDSSWNHIRTTAYDRAGHRCQICGKQGGSLWSRLATPDERKRGRTVECHEVWDWEVPDPASGVGIQKLKRLLILCPDCHLSFHEGRTLQEARKAGIEAEAADYIKARRMLLNRCDGETIDAQVAVDAEAWEATKSVRTWVVDLSHLAAQDFMEDHTLVLRDDNKAGVSPSQIGGISFRTEDGSSFAATPAADLASGGQPLPGAGSPTLF